MKDFNEELRDVIIELDYAEVQARKEAEEREAALQRQVSDFTEMLRSNQKFMTSVQNLLITGFRSGRKKIRLKVSGRAASGKPAWYLDSDGNEIEGWEPGMRCYLVDNGDRNNNICLNDCGIILENTVRSSNFREMCQAYVDFEETEKIFLQGLSKVFEGVDHLCSSYVHLEGHDKDDEYYVVDGVDFELV